MTHLKTDQNKMLSSGVRFNYGRMSHLFCLVLQICQAAEYLATRSSDIPRTISVLYSAGESLTVSLFTAFSTHSRQEYLALHYNLSVGTSLNILCIPSRCRSCRIWSDPVGWRRWWEGWRGEIQAAICTPGPAMEGPNTSRSALTGTCTLPGSKTQEKLFSKCVVTSAS